ncbi:MAG: hypothetical protein ACOCRX_10505 [Candidatus Woesearchaeota archaeon]
MNKIIKITVGITVIVLVVVAFNELSQTEESIELEEVGEEEKIKGEGVEDELKDEEKNEGSNLEEVAEMGLEEAQEKIGMKCIGSEASMDCDWNDAEYSFFRPEDWEEDRKDRIRACDEGWINEEYNMVTDGSTWHATTDYEEGNAALQEAFSDIGFDSEIVPYCR